MFESNFSGGEKRFAEDNYSKNGFAGKCNNLGNGWLMNKKQKPLHGRSVGDLKIF